MINYYEILQVSEKADQEVIEAAYKGLVKKYHPDRNHASDASDKMADINNAYSILKDPVSRFDYNQKLQRERTSKASTSAPSPSTSQTATERNEREYSNMKQKPEKQPEYEVKTKRKSSFKTFLNSISQVQNAQIYSILQNIKRNISKSEFYEIGIYSAILSDGSLKIVDQGQKTLFERVQFAFSSVLVFALGIVSVHTVVSGFKQNFSNIKEQPILALMIFLLVIISWATFRSRPKAYNLVFSAESLTIRLHGIFWRKIKYKKIHHTEVCIGSPSYVKITLKSGRSIKTLRDANVMSVANEILGVMVENCRTFYE